jgi:dephospho-CoA kinase
MIRIGITGGIGSGKTLICRMFKSLGIPVYHSDEEARSLMQEEASLVSGIVKLFGEEAYIDGSLNRSMIAKRVFQDNKLLNQLNALVHPAVGRDFVRWTETQRNTPYLIKEAAILFESGAEKGLDRVIVVTAPEELRIQRIIQRDQLSREQILSRMKQQWSDEERSQLADFIIVNDGKRMLIPQVLKIHRMFYDNYQKRQKG